MKVLLIVAHGSRGEKANDEIRRLEKRIGAHTAPIFDRVTSAFLEIARPSINSAIAMLVTEGAAKIGIFPYFLAEGTHVKNDIPKLVKHEQAKYPDVHFTVFPYFGTLQQSISLLIADYIRSISI